MVGWVERRSDSEQPVHSWKWSQITEGLPFFSTASATWVCMAKGSPIMAVAVTHAFIKLLRVTPSQNISVSSFITPPTEKIIAGIVYGNSRANGVNSPLHEEQALKMFTLFTLKKAAPGKEETSPAPLFVVYFCPRLYHFVPRDQLGTSTATHSASRPVPLCGRGVRAALTPAPVP